MRSHLLSPELMNWSNMICGAVWQSRELGFPQGQGVGFSPASSRIQSPTTGGIPTAWSRWDFVFCLTSRGCGSAG